MSNERRILRTAAFLLWVVLACQGIMVAQNAPEQASIAVVRLKGVDIGTANQGQFAAMLPALNAALRENGLFSVPSDDDLTAALDDEGIAQDELLDMDDLADLAEALGLQYILVGSVSQKMLTFHTHLRLYEAKENRLIGVVSSDQSIDPVNALSAFVAERVQALLASPADRDSLYQDFTWTQQVLLTYGPDRIDLLPPRVYFVNDNPPFEISAKVDMERMRSSFAVINISFYADGEHIGSIYPQLSVPRVLSEHDVRIGGHTFCFQLDVRELRTTSSGGIISANVVFTCRHCHDNE